MTAGAEDARRGQALGFGEAVLAAVLWGSSGIFSVHLFDRGVAPQSLALLRPALGVPMLAGLLLALFGPRPLRVPLRGLGVLALGAGTAVAVFQIAYQMSIDAVGVPSTVALVYLAPPVVVAVSGPLLGEWPSRRRVALALLTVAGVWITVLGAEAVTPRFGEPGVAWGVASGLSYAAYTLLGRHGARRYGSPATVLYSTMAACLWLALALPLVAEPVALPDSDAAWALLGAFALVSVALAQFLFFDALGRIEAGRASIASSVEPVVAALLATVLLSQGLGPAGWAGMALVVIGVAGVSASR